MHPLSALFLFGIFRVIPHDENFKIARDRRPALREQLELLWELQKIDLDLKNIKEERDRYPKEIEEAG